MLNQNNFRPVDIIVHTAEEHFKYIEEQRFKEFLDSIENQIESKIMNSPRILSCPSSPLAVIKQFSPRAIKTHSLLPKTIYDIHDNIINKPSNDDSEEENIYDIEEDIPPQLDAV